MHHLDRRLFVRIVGHDKYPFSIESDGYSGGRTNSVPVIDSVQDKACWQFLAGEVQEGEDSPVFTVYAKLMRYF